MQETKKCPFCDEMIKAVAKKCKFCKRMLEPDNYEQSSMQEKIDYLNKEFKNSYEIVSGNIIDAKEEVLQNISTSHDSFGRAKIRSRNTKNTIIWIKTNDNKEVCIKTTDKDINARTGQKISFLLPKLEKYPIGPLGYYNHSTNEEKILYEKPGAGCGCTIMGLLWLWLTCRTYEVVFENIGILKDEIIYYSWIILIRLHIISEQNFHTYNWDTFEPKNFDALVVLAVLLFYLITPFFIIIKNRKKRAKLNKTQNTIAQIVEEMKHQV